MNTNGHQADLKYARRQKANLQPDTNRLPPHDLTAEQGVLGCILLSPACLIECEGAFSGQEGMFYDEKHQAIYKAMKAVEAGLDLVTLQAKLKDLGELEAIGGLSYLLSLPDATPSAANLDYYLAILKNKFIARKMLQACAQAVGMVYENEQSSELLDAFRSKINEVDDMLQTKDAKPARAVLNKCINRYEQMLMGNDQGLFTGFVAIDANGGLYPGEMVLVCGPTGYGKSTLALNLMHHSLKSQIPTAVFSFEMSDQAWMDRLLSLDLNIDRRAFRSKDRFNQGVLEKITKNVSKLSKLPLWVCDSPVSTVEDIRRTVKHLAAKNGVRLVVVDYAQIVTPPKSIDSREQQVAYIGRSLRSIAQETNAVILVLSQLNDEGKVRESRALLHECHMCMTLQSRDEKLWVTCTKGRDTMFPDFPLDFDPLFCRMTQSSQVGQETI